MTNKTVCFLVLVIILVFTVLVFAGCVSETLPSASPPVVGPDQVDTLVKEVILPIKAPEKVPAENLKDIFAKITVNEGELVKLDLDASDPDNDSLRYSFSEPLSEKGEWQTKIGDAGEYVVTITASDGQLETSKKILLIVKAVNRKPVIEPQANIAVVEGDKIALSLKAVDPDKDPLVWSYSTPFDPDGTWQTKQGDAGTYTIIARVSDGYLQDSTSFNITVLKGNLPPTIEIEKELMVNEGETIKLAPRVADPEGKAVTVTYSGWMSRDTYTTNFEDAGKHKVIITASDGEKESVIEVWVTVNNVNRAPVIHGLIVK